MSTNFMIAAALAVTLSGCGALAPVTGSHYTSQDGKLAIHGELVDNSDVRIFVNGDKVIDDRISLLHGDGRFDGNWQGKPVSASCATAAGGRSGTTCQVAVGSERVTLTL
jgi:outer membrane lipoprotein SlyB